MISFDPCEQCFQFTPADGPAIRWQVRLEADGRWLEMADATVEVVAAQTWGVRLEYLAGALVWDMRAETDAAGSRLSLQSTLTNHGAAAIRLGAVVPFAATTLPLGGASVFLPGMPGQFERMVWRVAEAKAPTISKVKNQYFDAAAQRALQVGFTTFLRADTEVHHRGTEAGVFDVQAQADFAGWALAPGAATPVETFTLQTGTDPHAQLERWTDLVVQREQPQVWPGTPLGWLGWSWVDGYNVEQCQEVLLRNCAAINRRLAGFGIDYVWVSIANLPGGQPGAWLGWNEKNFPLGPEKLVHRLDELGFKLGLWCGAFWISAALKDEMRELEDALLRNPDGTLFVSLEHWRYGDSALLPVEQRPPLYALDPTHPKALAFLERAFAGNRERGVRYYMVDFLYASAGNLNRPGPQPGAAHGPLHDPAIVPGPEAFRTALEVIRRAAGPETYLLASTGPTLHTMGLVDGIRTGADFGEGRSIAKDSFFYPATYVINSPSYWTGCLPALRNQAAGRYTHRRLYLNDSGNVLTVDQPLPLADARMHATMHAMCGGPTMLGDDIDRMADDRLALIKKTLPRAPEVALAVDLFDAPAPDHPKIFHRRVDRPWGRFDVVAVYNFTPETLQLPVMLERLGLDPAADYLVWEFWDERYVGRVCGRLDVLVPPGSVKVFRLVRDEGRPVLLGTDLHVLMGEMEVTACSWDATTRTLRGTAVRPRGERGSVFMHAPATVSVANPRGHWIAKDGRDQSLIIRCALDLSSGSAEWCVRFADL